MKRAEITRLAVAADLYSGFVSVTALERFAALVAAAEREACEKVASDYADYQRSLGDEYAELRAMGALEVMDKISARGAK
jgi:hypothetical protein